MSLLNQTILKDLGSHLVVILFDYDQHHLLLLQEVSQSVKMLEAIWPDIAELHFDDLAQVTICVAQITQQSVDEWEDTS
jgi:hypothetical protein